VSNLIKKKLNAPNASKDTDWIPIIDANMLINIVITLINMESVSIVIDYISLILEENVN
jgi:hypothetical protein